MEALVMILILIAVLAILDFTSGQWGADSRPLIQDDHAR